MSAAPDQRAWQRSRNTQPRSSNQSPNPSGPSTKTTTPAPGNIWAERAKERSRSAAQRPALSKDANSGAKDGGKVAAEGYGSGSASGSVSSAPVGTQNVPVNGFNAREVRDFLRPEYKGPSYKIPDDDSTKTAGTRPPNFMANGQDFFVQLNKQLTELRSKK